jgi:hypothetical protein
VIWNSEVAEFVGGGEPEALVGLDLKRHATGEISRIDVEGAFVAIGHTPRPSCSPASSSSTRTAISGRAGTTRTSVPGVFACGDVMDKIYRQAVTAAGTGCMAALDAEKFLAEAEFDVARLDRRRRRLAGLGLDEPGIDEDRAVQPGGVAVEREREAPSHRPKPSRRFSCGCSRRKAAAAAARSGPLSLKSGSSPSLSPTPRRS